MSKKGLQFLESWLSEHITEGIKQQMDGDGASLSVELAERLIADAEKAGLSLDDLEPELGQPEVLIREALEADEGMNGEDGTTSLQVIGSGFGRTGTKSLKEALEQLGFGPCHHMHENIERPELVSHWQNVAAGKPVDWKEVFAGYRSQVDWPGAHVWRELSVAFPDAKVIHSVRPEEVWWNSFSKTIGKLGNTYQQMQLPPHIRNMTDAAFEMIGRQTFNGKMADRDTALAVYNLRTQQVREAIPPERLLVFDVAQGWEPLCRFLNVPVPNTPFPHLNLRADFWKALGGEPG